MTVQTGEVIDGRFIVEQRLGAGGAAEVFAVRHRTLQTLFVLKVLTIRQKSVQRRLILEGKVQSGLRHPHIVGVSDVVEVHGMSALVLEYVHGPNLATVIQSAPPVEPSDWSCWPAPRSTVRDHWSQSWTGPP